MTLTGGTFLFPEGGVVALTGSDFGATLDDRRRGTVDVDRGSAGPDAPLRAPRAPARAAICACTAESPCLRFSAAHRRRSFSGLGGFEGRPLRKGDVLRVGRWRERLSQESDRSRRFASVCRLRNVLRFTAGPQADWFPPRRCARSAEPPIASASNPIAWDFAWRAPAVAATSRRADDYRRRLARRDSGAAGRRADHFVCRSADHRRLSKNRQRDFRRHSPRGTASSAR